MNNLIITAIFFIKFDLNWMLNYIFVTHEIVHDRHTIYCTCTYSSIVILFILTHRSRSIENSLFIVLEQLEITALDMFLHGITLSIVYLSFVNPFVTGFFSHPQTLPSHIWDTRSERVKTNAQNNNYINNIQQSAISWNIKFEIKFDFDFLDITVTEHELINDIVNDSHDQSWGTTTERTLIRSAGY